MHKIRVLIADDHSIVREGLKQILSKEQDIDVIGEAVDGRDALAKIKALRPDVVLLDISMPELSGLEVATVVKNTLPETKLVVLSMHGDESSVRRILAAGAKCYVLKASPSKDILEAIRSAYRNTFFLSAQLKETVIQSYINPADAPSTRGYDRLTEREQQIFRLVAQGNSTRQIADFLCISIKTVEKHRTNIMSKLRIHDRFELLKYAIKIGVVDPELWNNK